MTIDKFRKKYDYPGSVVLLEGKRNVKENDKQKLISLGKILTENTKHILFRSGNAPGADTYFSLGVTAVSRNRMQAILPFKKYRLTYNIASQSFSLEDFALLEESNIILESRKNKKVCKLITRFIEGERDWITMKAAFIIRDTIKAIGTRDTIAPSTAALFYEDYDNPKSGGTGHTIQVCTRNNIPFFTQETWQTWL